MQVIDLTQEDVPVSTKANVRKRKRTYEKFVDTGSTKHSILPSTHITGANMIECLSETDYGVSDRDSETKYAVSKRGLPHQAPVSFPPSSEDSRPRVYHNPAIVRKEETQQREVAQYAVIHTISFDQKRADMRRALQYLPTKNARGPVSTAQTERAARISQASSASLERVDPVLSAVPVPCTKSASSKRVKSSEALPIVTAASSNEPKHGFTHRFTLGAEQGNSQVSMLESYTVTYTDCLESLKLWTSELPISAVLGFDTEGDGKVIQLCCLKNSTILIFVMRTMAIPRYLNDCSSVISNIIGSPQYLKVGIAAFDDAIKLSLAYNVRISEVFDLTYLTGDLQIDEHGQTTRAFKDDAKRGIIIIQDDGKSKNLPRGLKSLYRDLFVCQFRELVSLDSYHPPLFPARGEQKWITYPLRLDELAYAAKDALFGSLLYNSMSTKYTASELHQLKFRGRSELLRRQARRLQNQRNSHVAPNKVKKNYYHTGRPRGRDKARSDKRRKCN